MKKLLDITNLSISYGNKPTVKGVSLRLDEGEIHCLVGGTGSGKSTILHAIAGISSKGVHITAGTIVFDDTDLLAVDENYMTTRPGVFAAGDVVTGAKTVVHAVDGAKKAAEAMIRYMEEN